MKPITLIFLFIFISFHHTVCGQNRNKAMFMQNGFLVKEVELSAKANKTITLPFKSIFVFDKRNDTSITGFTNLSGKMAVYTMNYPEAELRGICV